MANIEKKLETESTVKAHIFRLEIDRVELQNGDKTYRDVIRHPGACAVVPITDDGDVICVKQFRYPFLAETLELPAGKLDWKDGVREDPSVCARRELKEETGADCAELISIGEYWSSPAILDEVIYLYVARGLTFGEQNLDEDEFIDVENIPLDRLTEMVMNGEIPDGKTQTAVLKAKYMLDGEKK